MNAFFPFIKVDHSPFIFTYKTVFYTITLPLLIVILVKLISFSLDEFHRIQQSTQSIRQLGNEQREAFLESITKNRYISLESKESISLSFNIEKNKPLLQQYSMCLSIIKSLNFQSSQFIHNDYIPINSFSFDSFHSNKPTFRDLINVKVELISLFETDFIFKSDSSVVTQALLNLVFSQSGEGNEYDTITGQLKEESLYIQFKLTKASSFYYQSAFLLHSIITSAYCLIYIALTQTIINQVKDSEANANSLCFIGVYLNTIWNAICFMSIVFYFLKHAFFGNYHYECIPPIFLYFFLFSYSELKLLTVLLQKQYSLSDSQLTPYDLRKKILHLYGLIYAIMCIIIGFHIDFLYNEWCIKIEIILTWLPQIVYNSVYYRKIFIPYVYIITVTFSRLLFPCFLQFQSADYAFGLKEKTILITSLGTMGTFVLFLLTQSLFGARWFLPALQKREDSLLYLDEEEIKKRKNEYYDIRCAICLYFLVRWSYSEDDDSYYVDIEFPAKDDQEVKRSTLRKKKPYHSCLFMLYFHQSGCLLSSHKKKFIITNCSHAFHTTCLETWLKRRNRCPTCREIIKL